MFASTCLLSLHLQIYFLSGNIFSRSQHYTRSQQPKCYSSSRMTKASNPGGRLFSYCRKPSDGKVRESLTHSLVLNHKSFRSQSFVLTAGLLHHTAGSHRERSAFKDPPCIKHSGEGAQTGATFVTEQNTKYDLRLAPLCCNLSRCAFGASSND